MKVMRAALFLAVPLAIQGAVITQPAGLNPGDTYHLVFVTSGGRDAMASDITEYDAFVQAEAAMSPALAALGVTWRAIGSTAAVDAVDHIAVAAPVFRLDGVMVASSSADMFDGTLAASISLNQFGSDWRVTVRTGSTAAGLRAGSEVLGAAVSQYGNSQYTILNWITEPHGGVPAGNAYSFYGISTALVVPTAIPEPGTTTLFIGGIALLSWSRMRTRAR
jgi:hypothetical protein